MSRHDTYSDPQSRSAMGASCWEYNEFWSLCHQWWPSRYCHFHRFPTQLQTYRCAATVFVVPAGHWKFVEYEANQEPDHGHCKGAPIRWRLDRIHLCSQQGRRGGPRTGSSQGDWDPRLRYPVRQTATSRIPPGQSRQSSKEDTVVCSH